VHNLLQGTTEREIPTEQNLVKVLFEGQTVDAKELKFEQKERSTGLYETATGVRVTIVHTVDAIYEIQGRTKPDGSPVYLVTGEAAINATPLTPALQEKAEEKK